MACRSLFVLALPLVVAGCPGDDSTTTDANNDSGSSGTTTAAASTGPGSTGSAESTSTGEPPAESTSTGGSSSGGSADSSSGGPPATSGVIEVCGNNQIEGDEVCDLAQLGGETCQSLGYQGGTLGCLLTCEDYNLLGCFICGNEVVDIAEDCEEVVPKGVTCESLGWEAGTLACGDDCLWDESDCSICGDGIQAGPEQCDGIDLGGETCVSIGFDMGNLGCNIATCSFDFSDCSGGQYQQNFEAGPPLPTEFTTGGAMDWSVITGANAISGSYSATSNDLGEGQNNFMSLDVSFAVAGDIEFLHSESSEGSFDYLQFYVDGVLQQEWSGINPPAVYNQAIGAGVHTLEWRYDKDGIVSVGLDRVWVDDIFITAGVPI